MIDDEGCVPAFDHPAGYDWPHGSRAEYDKEFTEMAGGEGEVYGTDWLMVNMWIKDSLLGAGVDVSNSVVRWMAFKIAARVCAELKREG